MSRGCTFHRTLRFSNVKMGKRCLGISIFQQNYLRYLLWNYWATFWIEFFKSMATTFSFFDSEKEHFWSSLKLLSGFILKFPQNFVINFNYQIWRSLNRKHNCLSMIRDQCTKPSSAMDTLFHSLIKTHSWAGLSWKAFDKEFIGYPRLPRSDTSM